MVVGLGLAPHRPPFEDFAGTSGQAPLAGQAGSSTPGSFAVVLCWCLKEPAPGAVTATPAMPARMQWDAEQAQRLRGPDCSVRAAAEWPGRPR